MCYVIIKISFSAGCELIFHKKSDTVFFLFEQQSIDSRSIWKEITWYFVFAYKSFSEDLAHRLKEETVLRLVLKKAFPQMRCATIWINWMLNDPEVP